MPRVVPKDTSTGVSERRGGHVDVERRRGVFADLRELDACRFVSVAELLGREREDLRSEQGRARSRGKDSDGGDGGVYGSSDASPSCSGRCEWQGPATVPPEPAAASESSLSLADDPVWSSWESAWEASLAASSLS